MVEEKVAEGDGNEAKPDNEEHPSHAKHVVEQPCQHGASLDSKGMLQWVMWQIQ